MKLNLLSATGFLLFSGALVFSPITSWSCYAVLSTNTWECSGNNGTRQILPPFMRHTAAVRVDSKSKTDTVKAKMNAIYSSLL